MEVIYATDHVHRFLLKMESPVRSRARHLIKLLEQRGHELRMPHSKPLGDGIFELRLRGSHSIRLLYGFYEGKAYILHGLLKKEGSLSQRDIEYASNIYKQVVAHV